MRCPLQGIFGAFAFESTGSGFVRDRANSRRETAMAYDIQATSSRRSRIRRPTTIVEVAVVLALVTFGLVLAGGARGVGNPPTVTLGPISVLDGVAVVSGSLGGDSVAQAVLQINGRPVGVDASGDFWAVVDLDGETALVLSLVGGEDETIVIRIPVTVLLGNGGNGVLDALTDAGISINVPPEGFQVFDGQMPEVTGKVQDDEKLSRLTVNGRDVLHLLEPNGSFSVFPRSESTRQVTVVATDRSGVSQTSAFRTTQVKTVIKTVAGKSVSAAGAKGVTIAKVRFDKRRLVSKKRLGIVVLVKDKRGFLIRGAALRLKGMPLRYLVDGANCAGFTNRLGRATFGYRLHEKAFTGKARRLTIVVRANTPTASAKKKVMLKLPALLPT
jgi:hypothetical protein